MNNTNVSRALTPFMVNTLMEIHEREILGQDLCGQETKYIAGLYRRGLIALKLCTNKSGKPYMGFCVTDAGREFLDRNINTVKRV